GHKERGPDNTRLQQAARNFRALPGRNPLEQRRENSGEQPHSRAYVDDRDYDPRGRGTRMAVDADYPRVGLRERIISGQLLERPLVAKAADRTVDQTRILARQIFVAQTAR